MITRDSADWSGTKVWLNLKIAEAREALESPVCGIKEADHLRGEIIAYRKLISHVEPSNVIPFSEPVAAPGTNY